MNRHLGRAMRATCLLAIAGMVWFAAASWAGEVKVKEGQPAPDVNLPATQPETVLPGSKGSLRLSDLKGKKNVVLWFYPKALTGG
jgi:hypothetical protein